MTQQLPLRSELPLELTWQLELLYADQAAYESALEEFKSKVTEFATSYNGKLADQTLLLKSLADYATIIEQLHRISGYASLGYETDKLNEVYESNMSSVEDLY